MHQIFRLTLGMVFILTLTTGEALRSIMAATAAGEARRPKAISPEGGPLRTGGGRLQSGHCHRQFNRARYNPALE